MAFLLFFYILQRRVPSHPRPAPASVTSGNVGADLEETVKEMRPRGLCLQVWEASCCRASHRQRGTCRPFLNVRNESFAQVWMCSWHSQTQATHLMDSRAVFWGDVSSQSAARQDPGCCLAFPTGVGTLLPWQRAPRTPCQIHDKNNRRLPLSS